MDMKKVTCAVLVAAAAVSATMAVSEGPAAAPAAAPGPSSDAAAALPAMDLRDNSERCLLAVDADEGEEGIEGGSLESPAGTELNDCDGDIILEPYEGMEFESEDAAKIFYDKYARQLGFVMRVMSCRRSEKDGRILARRLGCNKEGHCVSIRGKFGAVRKPRPSTREGCKAMIHVKYDKSGKWVITKFVKEHNHPLVVSPREARQTMDDAPSLLLYCGTKYNERILLETVPPKPTCSPFPNFLHLVSSDFCSSFLECSNQIAAHTHDQMTNEYNYSNITCFDTFVCDALRDCLHFHLYLNGWSHDDHPPSILVAREYSTIPFVDEKDKQIQELTIELRNKKRLCSTYQEQLAAFMKIVEEHTDQLSKKVQNVVTNLKEFESIEQELLHPR
ncbi:hypothetical protein Csa_001154 [Cucumis sativus]|nr:hypothetical protein Csa_001154 [Cucumis sativus]